MSKSLLVVSITSPTGTQYLNLDSAGAKSTEAYTALTARVAGTFSNLQALVNNVGSSRVIQFRKNGANGNQVINPTNTTAGRFTDAVNTDAVTAGDTFGVVNTVSTTINNLRLNFEATSNHVAFFSTTSAAGLGLVSNNSTTYVPISGTLSNNGTESLRQFTMRNAGTLKNASCYVSSNTRTSATTITLRKNGANSSVVLTIGAGLTGLFEDLSNTESIASGDLLDWKATAGAGVTDTLTLERVSCVIESTNATNDVFSGTNTARTASATPTYYIPGGASAGTTAEGSTKVEHGFSVTATKLRILVTANTCTGDVSLKSRVNGAAGGMSLVITAGLTGFFEDASGSDVLGPNDDYDFELNNGTSGALTFSYIAVTEQDTTSSVGAGNLAATGVGTVSFVGFSIAPSVLAATGSGLVNIQGLSVAPAVAAWTGSGGLSGVGWVVALATFAMGGAGALSASGRAIMVAVWQATGQAVVNFLQPTVVVPTPPNRVAVTSLKSRLVAAIKNPRTAIAVLHNRKDKV